MPNVFLNHSHFIFEIESPLEPEAYQASIHSSPPPKCVCVVVVGGDCERIPPRLASFLFYGS